MRRYFEDAGGADGKAQWYPGPCRNKGRWDKAPREGRQHRWDKAPRKGQQHRHGAGVPHARGRRATGEGAGSQTARSPCAAFPCGVFGSA